MPLALALEVIEQTARALAAAEACGVVHRDLKPSNLMIELDASESLVVKVIDYGVAKVVASRRKRAPIRLGLTSLAPQHLPARSSLPALDKRPSIHVRTSTHSRLRFGIYSAAERRLSDARWKKFERDKLTDRRWNSSRLRTSPPGGCTVEVDVGD